MALRLEIRLHQCRENGLTGIIKNVRTKLSIIALQKPSIGKQYFLKWLEGAHREFNPSELRDP
jgi:hypothetical protein